MPAGNQERQRGLRELAVFEDINGDVPDEVVDAVQGLVEVRRERFGCRDTDDEGPHQAGPSRDGDGVDVGQIDVGLLRRAPNRGDEGRQVCAAGDLWDDSTEADVEIDGAGDLVGQELTAPDDADACLVAGGFDAEDQRLAHSSSLLSRMSASTPAP